MERSINVNPDNTKQIGSLYLRWSESTIAKTVATEDKNDPDFLVDYDAKGKLVGIEILGLSQIQKLYKALWPSVAH
jgi:uncharacterized protein YuzE